jgi:hypothetical protein
MDMTTGSLKNTFQFPDEGIAEILRACPKLVDFTVWSGHVGSPSLAALMAIYETVSHLNLIGVIIEGGIGEHILRNCPMVR